MMRTKKIKIYGIEAAVLVVLIAFVPITIANPPGIPEGENIEERESDDFTIDTFDIPGCPPIPTDGIPPDPKDPTIEFPDDLDIEELFPCQPDPDDGGIIDDIIDFINYINYFPDLYQRLFGDWVEVAYGC